MSHQDGRAGNHRTSLGRRSLPGICGPTATGRRRPRVRRLAFERLEEREVLAGELVFDAAFQLGDEFGDLGKVVKTDDSGNVFIAGGMAGTIDFDPGAGTTNLSGNLYVAKYSAAGDLIWARTLTGEFGYFGGDIAIDGSGSVFVASSFQNTVDFDPGAGVFNLNAGDSKDGFILKLTSGGSFSWVRTLGGTGEADTYGIAIDPAGNLVASGTFAGTIDFDPGASSTNRTAAGGLDAWVASLSDSGAFRWAATTGAGGEDRAVDIGVDTTGNIYVLGDFEGTADFDPGAGTSSLSSQGYEDVFLWKLSNSGGLTWAKQIGGVATERAGGMQVDPTGNLHITGFFYGDVDFDPGPAVYVLTPNGGDAFVSKLDSAGELGWAQKLGGSGFDQGTAIAVDGAGAVFVTGTFQTTADFDPGAGTANLTSAGGDDVFIVRLTDATGAYQWAGALGGSDQDRSYSIAVGGLADTGVLVTGEFRGTADFDPGAGAFSLVSYGAEDAFVARLTYAPSAPHVTVSQAVGQADPTNAAPVHFTVSFTETVDGFDSSDVVLSGTAPGTLVAVVTPAGSGSSFDVAVSGMTGSGTVVVTIPPAAAVDDEGNPNVASTSTDNQVVIDLDPPQAGLISPVQGSSIPFGALNARRYIDITISDATAGLDTATLIDGAAEFAVLRDGVPLPGVTLADDPTLISGATFRYAFSGDFTAGPISIRAFSSSYADNLGNLNPSGPIGFFVVDDLPTLGINAPTVTEGNSGTVNLTFVVSLSYPSDQVVTVGFATQDGTAVAGVDYTAKSGALTFLSGVTSQTVSVVVRGDYLDEADETVLLALSSPVNAKLPVEPGVGTILDNDAAVRISIADVTVAEGAENATFTVRLSATSGRHVEAIYDTHAETATPDADYTAVSGTLVFAPGETTKTISVPILQDLLDEASESFDVQLAGAVNATFDDAVGRGFITDDDPVPTVTIDDVAVTEGDDVQVPAVFTVSLSSPSGQAVSVRYATANVTAASGSDYLAVLLNTLTFAPGEAAKTVTVWINGDQSDEADETFRMNLSTPTNATLVRTFGTGTISDNDPEPLMSIGDASLVETDSGTRVATFPVTLAAPSSRTVTVQYATATGSASADDFYAKSGTLTFAPGVVRVDVTVSVIGDTRVEGDEAFQVNLSNATAATILDGDGLGTILDNDPSVTVADITVSETGAAIFTVKFSKAPTGNVEIAYATDNGTAASGTDYSASIGTLTFTPTGPLSQTVTVPVINDLIDEDNETFYLNLELFSGFAYIADATALGMITDNDLPPTLSIANTGGNEATGLSEFTVNLARESGKTVTVKYATSGVSATSGVDFASTSGMLTFSPGETSKVVPVVIHDDASDEYDSEAFRATLSSPTNATIPSGASTSISQIEDDDLPPLITIHDAAVVEGDSRTKNMQFTVSLSAASGKTVSVAYATISGTATSGKDFRPASGTLTFSPGVTTRTFNVTIIGELIDEADVETFQVQLSDSVNGMLDLLTATGSIQDNDAPPFLSIGNASATEDDIDGVNGFVATFLVSLSRASERPVQVNYNLTYGTAVDGEDYVDESGTLVFAPGVTVQPITVQYLGDTLDEINETFTAHLSDPVNATVQTGIGTGTITDNDLPPVITIENPEGPVVEGETLDFPIRFSDPSGKVVTIALSYSGVSPNSATAGTDYETHLSIQIPAGITEVLLDADTLNDLVFENTEAFQVRIASTDATVDPAHATAVGTILDNDPRPELAIDSIEMVEGNANTKNYVFTITKTNASALPVTVKYATSLMPGSADVDPALSGEDFYAKSGTLTFPASALASQVQTVSVQVRGDLKVEKDEWFKVELSAATNADITTGWGIGMIINDDPTLSVSDVTVTEGDTAPVLARFTVKLSAPSNLPVTVDYRTRDGSATAGEDYEDFSSGESLTFAPGQTSQTIDVTIPGDRIDEPNRNFYLDLSSPTNAFLTGGVETVSATGTIIDNDAAPVLRIDGPFSVPEGDDGVFQQAFQLTLSAESALPVSVQVKTTNGSASVADNDYEPLSPFRVEFSPRTPGSAGETTQWFTVSVVGDAKPESNESFYVDLSSPLNATLGNTRGTLTILDDDNRTLAINDVSVQEGNSGTTTAMFTVTLSRESSQPVSVNVYTQNGSASAPGDYVAIPSTTIVFEPGQTVQQVYVDVKGDTTKEANETFYVKLSTPVNATIADATGIGTIMNDDIGAWQISVTLFGSGAVYDVGYPTKIDTREGRFIATYGSNDFPSLQAIDGNGSLAHSAEWYNAVTLQQIGWGTALSLTPNSIEDGLPLLVYLQGGGPLMADPAFTPVNAGAGVTVDAAALSRIGQAGIDVWLATGLSPSERQRLRNVRFEIADLPGGRLGFAAGDRVFIDRDAAGFGWFIDPTPGEQEEFLRVGEGVWQAADRTAAADRIDLLTAVMHELGHVLGLDDIDPSRIADDLMTATLAPGLRRL